MSYPFLIESSAQIEENLQAAPDRNGQKRGFLQPGQGGELAVDQKV